MYFQGKQKGLILTSTNQDFLRSTFGDEITASYGNAITLKAIQKKVAGRMIDTILIGIPPQTERTEEQIVKELGFEPDK